MTTRDGQMIATEPGVRRGAGRSHLVAEPGTTLHILIVDDSGVARGMLRQIIEHESDLRVVGSVGNGQQALQAAAASAASGVPVDAVVLDLEMPVMDGLTALPRLLRLDPPPRVIVASTLTRRGAVASVKALAAGASDYICKPGAAPGDRAAFAAELIDKLRCWGRQRRAAGSPGAAAARAPALARSEAGRGSTAGGPRRSGPSGAAGPRRAAVRVIAIGSSTGGPQALSVVLAGLGPIRSVPVLITQHMPPLFTAMLAEQLGRTTGRRCQEARDGELAQPGCIYVAPGHAHLLAEAEAGGLRLRLSEGEPENFCRPAVDPMFRSLARACGAACVGVVLTGMGHDGLTGARLLRAAGATILAQDEATSVVWGMPGAVARGGAADAVLPLAELAPAVVALVQGAGA